MSDNTAYTHDNLVHLLDTCSAEAVYGSTSCKRPIRVQLRVVGEKIEDAGGAVEGCSYSRQCLGTLLSMVKGMDINDAWYLTGQELQEKLDAPNPKLDCETFVVACFKLALRAWEKRNLQNA